MGLRKRLFIGSHMLKMQFASGGFFPFPPLDNENKLCYTAVVPLKGSEGGKDHELQKHR